VHGRLVSAPRQRFGQLIERTPAAPTAAANRCLESVGLVHDFASQSVNGLHHSPQIELSPISLLSVRHVSEHFVVLFARPNGGLLVGPRLGQISHLCLVTSAASQGFYSPMKGCNSALFLGGPPSRSVAFAWDLPWLLRVCATGNIHNRPGSWVGERTASVD
jgi:hypothetical protein